MSSAMVALAIATGFERSWLVLKRLGATPLRRGELIAAKSLAVLAILAVQVVAVLAVATWSWATARARAPWLKAGGPGPGDGGLRRAGPRHGRRAARLDHAGAGQRPLRRAAAGQRPGVPLDRLPGWLAAAAAVLPAAALADLLRAGLGAAAAAGVATDLAVLAAWAGGAVALAVRVFRWE